ncbi:MAG: acetylxylan esterase, partial [Lentisphaeria bacterium]|nr:acetylxylan esterase [Lentisphaeria bacterium]
MNKLLSILLLTVSGMSTFAAVLEMKPAEDRIYKIGETVTFTAAAKSDDGKLLSDGSYTLQVTESGGRKIVKDITVKVSEKNPYTFKAKLDKPGFLMVICKGYVPEGGKLTGWKNKPRHPAVIGAAVEPEKVVAGSEMPEDFHEFWKKGVENFKKAEVVIEPAGRIKLKGYKVSRITVKFPDGSGLIDGFLSVPLKKGKYPVVAGVPGAGPGTVGPQTIFRPSKPVIMLVMNVHHFRTADTSAQQKKLYEDYVKQFKITRAYMRENAWDRDKYVYRNTWLAISRAMDYVATLPEYDGKHFAAVGSSQGGGSALAVSYLNKNVTCTVAHVPALCDHNGWRLGRRSGWPDLHVQLKGKADKAAEYFDGANFAAGIRNPVLVGV